MLFAVNISGGIVGWARLAFLWLVKRGWENHLHLHLNSTYLFTPIVGNNLYCVLTSTVYIMRYSEALFGYNLCISFDGWRRRQSDS